MTETFRIRKIVKYQGIAFTALFLAAVVGVSSVFYLEEPAKHGFKGEHSVVVVGGLGILVFGTMLVMSIYTWIAYYAERFTIDGTALSIRTMLQNRPFDVSELERMEWSIYPRGGSLRFRVLGSKARLDLYGYSKEDRLRIIRELVGLVPHQIQENWPLFCHRVALPLRDGTPSIAPADSFSETFTITRKRYDWMLVIALPLSMTLAVTLWVCLSFWQFIILPLVVIAAWLLLRFNVPREGRNEERLTSTSQGRGEIIGCSAVGGSQLLMLGLAMLGFEKPVVCGAACVVLLAAFPPMFYYLHKSDKQRKATEQRGAESAPAIWRQGEIGSQC